MFGHVRQNVFVECRKGRLGLRVRRVELQKVRRREAFVEDQNEAHEINVVMYACVIDVVLAEELRQNSERCVLQVGPIEVWAEFLVFCKIRRLIAHTTK